MYIVKLQLENLVVKYCADGLRIEVGDVEFTLVVKVFNGISSFSVNANFYREITINCS